MTHEHLGERKRRKGPSLLPLILFVIFFGLSYPLIHQYTLGDQLSYRALYEAFEDVDFFQVPFIAQAYINAAEPISTYILWAGSNANIEKDVFISIFNAAFLLAIYLAAKKHHANHLTTLLLLVNFYTIVLLTGAERLKFAYLFLTLYMIASQGWKKWLLLTLATLSHLQVVILIASISFGINAKKYASQIWRAKIKKTDAIKFIAAAIALLLIITTSAQQTNEKLSSYYSIRDLNEIYQLPILLAIGLIFTKDKSLIFLTMLPLFIATIFLGGERVNMMAVTAFIYIFALEGKINHPINQIILMYLTIKGALFTINIFTYGTGFIAN